MDFLLFKRSFEKAELLPVYVVYGEEAFFIHEAVSLIRSRILGKEETGVSLTEIGGAETSFPAVVNELDRRTSFFNKLNRKGGTVACRRIQDAQLLSWITSRAQSY